MWVRFLDSSQHCLCFSTFHMTGGGREWLLRQNIQNLNHLSACSVLAPQKPVSYKLLGLQTSTMAISGTPMCAASLSSTPILIYPKPLKKETATTYIRPISPRRSFYDTTHNTLFISKLPSPKTMMYVVVPTPQVKISPYTALYI
jgi:hypothetical protein